MGKNLKLIKYSKNSNPSRKSFDLSLYNYKIKKKLSSKLGKNLLKKFDNSNIFTKPSFIDKNDFKKETTNLNSNIILMLHNYISLNKNIQNKKDFTDNFMNVIKNLSINEIELAYMTIILDKIESTDINKEALKNLLYIGLASKMKLCPDNPQNIINEIEKNKNNNNKFKDTFNEWMNNSNIIKILNDNISDVDKRFRKLKNPLDINVHKKLYINYNETINKIVPNINKEDKMDINLVSKINCNNNNINNINTNKFFNIQSGLIDNISFKVGGGLTRNIAIKPLTFLQQEMESFSSYNEILDLKFNNSYGRPKDSINGYKIQTSFTLNK